MNAAIFRLFFYLPADIFRPNASDVAPIYAGADKVVAEYQKQSDAYLAGAGKQSKR